MQGLAGWVAPIATMLAAMLTAANLGARATGWGFVIFAVGSVAWVMVAIATGQMNLLYSNAFLTLVNLFGVWRWLVHRVRVDDSAEAAAEHSTHRPDRPDLFAASSLDGMVVAGADGAPLGKVVEAMTACDSGRIDYLIVSVGGVGGAGETLYKLPWHGLRVVEAEIATRLDAATITRLAPAERVA